MKRRYFIGQRIGRLVITGPSMKKPNGNWAWPIRCDCGVEKMMYSSSLATAVSCGCKRREFFIIERSKKTHGKRKTLAYNSWSHMRARCYRPTNNEYHRYGARGIKVCERWRDFANFYADMGDRPSSEYSLDRIDPNGNYEPSNCRWGLRIDEAKNRRPSSEWRMTKNNPLYHPYMLAVGQLSFGV